MRIHKKAQRIYKIISLCSTFFLIIGRLFAGLVDNDSLQPDDYVYSLNSSFVNVPYQRTNTLGGGESACNVSIYVDTNSGFTSPSTYSISLNGGQYNVTTSLGSTYFWLISGHVYDTVDACGSGSNIVSSTQSYEIIHFSGTVDIPTVSNQTNIVLTLTSTHNITYTITGDLTTIYTGSLSGTMTIPVTLSGDIGTKNIYVLYSGGHLSYTLSGTTTYETTPPTLASYAPADNALLSTYDVNFIWSGADASGISGYDFTLIEQNGTQITHVVTGSTGMTISGLSGGTYEWRVIVEDNGGNERYVGRQTFTIGDIDGNVSIEETYLNTGTARTTVSILDNGTGYITNAAYTISGDVLNVITGTVTSSTAIDVPLATGNGNKTITLTLTSGDITFTDSDTVYVDLTNPTISAITNLSGVVYNNTDITFQRTGSDNESGMSGYTLYVTDIYDTVVVQTGTTNTQKSLTLNNGNYKWYVVATDLAGNTSGTIVQSFGVNSYLPHKYVVTVTPTSIYDDQTTNLTIKAVDKNNNVINNRYSTDLTITIIGNNITGGSYTLPSNGSIAFSGYQKTYTGIAITKSGTFTINVIDDNYTYISGSTSITVLENPGTLAGTIGIAGSDHVVANSKIYVDTYTIDLSLTTTQAANYTITGDIISTRNGSITSSVTTDVTLTSGDGAKTVYVTYSTGLLSIQKSLLVYLDKTIPTTPTLSKPVSGETVTGITLQWGISTDTGVGLLHYDYIVSQQTSFANALFSGTTTNTGITYTGTLSKTGTYYRKITAKDSFAHTASASGQFILTGALTAPTLSKPADNTSIKNDTTFSRTTGNDTIGTISGYTFQLATGTSFSGNIAYTNTITGTNFVFDHDEVDTGTYYWRVVVTNTGNQQSISNYRKIIVIASDAAGLEDFTFDDITNADKNKVYKSNTITIDGLATNAVVNITIDRGALYKNDTFAGKSATGSNDDEFYIELVSSDTKGKTVSADMTIVDKTASFYVSTQGKNLSLSQQLTIISMFNTFIKSYNGTDNKLDTLLYTMRNSIIDRIDDDAYDSDGELSFLIDIIDGQLGKDNNEDDDKEDDSNNNDVYTAPNGKKYYIIYNSARKAYTASNLLRPKYFATRAFLVQYIDQYNRGSQRNLQIISNEGSYTAPNGKKYELVHTPQGYASTTFSSIKYFSTLVELKGFIDKHNPVKERNHIEDSSFTPVTYVAPNGKKYTLKKSNKGYFAPEFQTPQYFSDLNKLKTHINTYNKS